jgi:hypothetical protein
MFYQQRIVLSGRWQNMVVSPLIQGSVAYKVKGMGCGRGGVGKGKGPGWKRMSQVGRKEGVGYVRRGIKLKRE